MESDSQKPQRSPVWVWISADGERWRITHTQDGIWSCPIGLGGKRVGSWESGLPNSLGIWPDLKRRE